MDGSVPFVVMNRNNMMLITSMESQLKTDTACQNVPDAIKEKFFARVKLQRPCNTVKFLLQSVVYESCIPWRA